MVKTQRCGLVAIIGRPNVGKSTLLNRLIGQKISITSRKPQTTRHRILGISTQEEAQIIYVDTPGLHKNSPRALNRYMNRIAATTIREVDVLIFMVEGLVWKADDDWILLKIKESEVPVVLVINKVDRVKDKSELLPYITELNKKMQFAAILPLSAKTATNLNDLEKTIAGYLPASEFFYPTEQVTDRSERFMVAEIVREKLIRNLGQEVPYDTTVEIEKFEQEPKILRIAAVIYVNKPGQKAIVIGDKGSRLKQIGQQARLDMEKFFAQKVFLQLWVKVKQGWSDDERALRSLGYD